MNTTFYLEDDNNKEVNFNGETLTFTLQMIKIPTTKRAFRILKVIHFAWVDDRELQQKAFTVI